MTTFEDRERAFEAKYAHDEEFRFLVLARRDKLFAHWLAAKLRLAPEAEAALVAAVLHLGGRRHDEQVLLHAAQFAAQHGGAVPITEMAVALGEAATQAQQQMMAAPFHSP